MSGDERDGWWVEAGALRRAGLRAVVTGGPLLLLVPAYGLAAGGAAALGMGGLMGLAALVEELCGRRAPGFGRDLLALLAVWVLAGASVPAAGAQFVWARTQSASEAALGPHMPPLVALGVALGGPVGVAAVVRAGERQRLAADARGDRLATAERATWWYVASGLAAALLAGVATASGALFVGPATPALLGGVLVGLGSFAVWMVLSPAIVQLLLWLDELEARLFPEPA